MSTYRALLIAALMLALCGVAWGQLFDYFGGHQSSGLVGGASNRDPRGNTGKERMCQHGMLSLHGPVVFPPSAPGTETSGVRVGASGYGFVPGPPRGGAHGPFAGGFNSW